LLLLCFAIREEQDEDDSDSDTKLEPEENGSSTEVKKESGTHLIDKVQACRFSFSDADSH
jgi:hypothetical protein